MVAPQAGLEAHAKSAGGRVERRYVVLSLKGRDLKWEQARGSLKAAQARDLVCTAGLLHGELAGSVWRAAAVRFALHKGPQVLQRRRCRSPHVGIRAGALQLLQQREAARCHDGMLIGRLAGGLAQGGRHNLSGVSRPD